MSYIIVGNTMVNDLLFTENRLIKQILGGAVYCVSGLLPWTQDVLYVSGVGKDFSEWYGDYFKINKLGYEGLKYSLPKTNYNIVEYADDGQWHEYSIYSPTYFEDHKEDISIEIEDFIHLVDDTSKGLYTESRVSESFWKNIHVLKEKFPNLKIMWEIPTEDALIEERRAHAIQNIDNCDMFSINLPEAKALFNLKDETACIKTLLTLNKPVFFRVGEKGAYLLMDDKALFLQSIGASKAIDPTGCGNISTTTAMFGLCEAYTPQRILAMANITAYYNTKQYGPKISYSQEELRDIEELIELYSEKSTYIELI